MADTNFGFRKLSTQDYFDESRDLLMDEYSLKLDELSEDIDDADNEYEAEKKRVEDQYSYDKSTLEKKNKLSVQGIRKSLGDALERTYGRYTKIGSFQPTQFGLRNLKTRELLNDDDKKRVLSGKALSEKMTELDREVDVDFAKAASKKQGKKKDKSLEFRDLELKTKKDLLSINKKQSDKVRKYEDEWFEAKTAYTNPMTRASGQAQTNRENRRGRVNPYSL